LRARERHRGRDEDARPDDRRAEQVGRELHLLPPTSQAWNVAHARATAYGYRLVPSKVPRFGAIGLSSRWMKLARVEGVMRRALLRRARGTGSAMLVAAMLVVSACGTPS